LIQRKKVGSTEKRAKILVESFCETVYLAIYTREEEEKTKAPIFTSIRMLQDIVQSIFEPGVNSHVLKAVNIIFVCLIIVGIGLVLFSGFNIHLLVLLVLSSGLLISINW